MNDLEQLLGMLETDEDDEITRLILADCYEELGQDEEAERHRKWKAAKEVLKMFEREGNRDDDYEWHMTYETLIEEGRFTVELLSEENKNYATLSCGNNMCMCDLLRNRAEEFWRNWSIVTGIEVPRNEGELQFPEDCVPGFRCAC